MKLFNKVFASICEQVDPQDKSGYTEHDVMTLITTIKQMYKRRNRFFSHLLSQVPIIIVPGNTSNIKTMCVDGNGNMYINIDFAYEMLYGTPADKIVKNDQYQYEQGDPYITGGTDGQRLFAAIITHELQHIFKNHIKRFRDTKRDIMLVSGYSLANIATDLEINDELMHRWGYFLPKGGIITEPNGDYTVEAEGKKHTINVRGLSPERIYDMLEQIIPKDAQQPPPSPSSGKVDIEVGDIVVNKAGKYGEVVSIDQNGNAKIVELTEQEAKQRVKQA